MTHPRHYALVASKNLGKLPPEAVVGEQLDDGRFVVMLRGAEVSWGAFATPLPPERDLMIAQVQQGRTRKDASARSALAIAEPGADARTPPALGTDKVAMTSPPAPAPEDSP